MWRACRVAALLQLRSKTARMPVIRMPQQLGGIKWYFTSIAGVDRDFLLSRSTRDLSHELGDSKIGDVTEALKEELTDAVAREDVASEEIIDLFTIAQKTGSTSVMLDAFNFLERKFPSHISFAIYGEVFRILARKKNSQRLIQIYETSKPCFNAVPEMIYRFGIVGYLQNDDMESADKIWQEMSNAGHETTNEITSRLMMAYARRGDVEKVEELYESVDPQIGRWHESCIDRVILSMGIIQQPSKSFEFYSNSSMKLSGGTLIALLSVCTNNNCKQQALDILANRKKFDLRLDARGYNRIMLTLEFLERNDEIKDILEEMVEKRIRFDTKTHQIIERNAHFLEDTSFVASPSNSRAAGFTISPRIRELLAQGNFSEAAAYVDSIVKSVDESQLPEDFQGEIPEGALVVSANVAKDAVQTYIKTGQPDKVAALVKGFSMVRGKYAYALAEVITHYLKLNTKTGDELSYAAIKAMLFQEAQIYRVNDALMLLRRFHDPDATVELFNQLLASYWRMDGSNARVKNENEDNKKPNYVNFNIGKVIDLVMQTLVENGRVTDALETLNMIESRGLQASRLNFFVILRSMRKYLRNSSKGTKNQKVVYDIVSFQAVLKGLKKRDMKVNKAILSCLCPAYSGANKQQRLELLEAFDESLSDPNDNFVLPHVCYGTLLAFAAQERTMPELKTIYDEAVCTLDKKETLGVPRDWVSILIRKLSEDGNVEEAEQLTKKMPDVCGGFTLQAIVAVLRGALTAQKLDVVDSMLALMEERNFIMLLADAYDLVHLARQQDLSLKALDIIRVFERGNLKEVAPAVDGSGNLEQAYVRRQHRDIHALRKVRTMYSVALKACEKGGLWKQALVLRDRMTTLLGKEAMEEITASMSLLPRQRKEKQSTDE